MSVPNPDDEVHACVARGQLFRTAKVNDTMLLLNPSKSSGHIGLRTTFAPGQSLEKGDGSVVGVSKAVDVLVRSQEGVEPRLAPKTGEPLDDDVNVMHRLSEAQYRALNDVQFVERLNAKITEARVAARASGNPIPGTLLQDEPCDVLLPRGLQRVGYVPTTDELTEENVDTFPSRTGYAPGRFMRQPPGVYAREPPPRARVGCTCGRI